MTYIDGFVAAVPTANREKFKKHADEAAAIFKEYGALSVVECWGDDVPDGKITSFPMAVQRKDDETVVFSWIVWPSKEARKAAWDKVMADPRMKPEENPMPFDGKRMIQRVHMHGAPDGLQSGRHLQNVIHKFHHRQDARLRRQVPGSRSR